MTCKHTHTTTRERGYIAPASLRNPNPAAHGGVRVEERCDDCGAQRVTNVNGRHTEASDWWVEETDAD